MTKNALPGIRDKYGRHNKNKNWSLNLNRTNQEKQTDKQLLKIKTTTSTQKYVKAGIKQTKPIYEEGRTRTYDLKGMDLQSTALTTQPPLQERRESNPHHWFWKPIFYLWTTLFLGQKGIEPLYDRHERSVLTIKLQALSGLESYSNEYSYKNKIRQKHKKRAEQRIERVVLKYMG